MVGKGSLRSAKRPPSSSSSSAAVSRSKRARRAPGWLDTSDGSQPYKCPLSSCDHSFKTNQGRWKHYFAAHDPELDQGEKEGIPMPYKCHYCPKRYRSRNSRYAHTQVYHRGKFNRRRMPESEAESDAASDLDQATTFPCPLCPRVFTTAGSLRMHRHNGHPKDSVDGEFKCPLCPRTFFRRDSLQRHYKRDHPKGKPLAFPKKREWRDKGKGKYKCPFHDCGRTFAYLSGLRRHHRRDHKLALPREGGLKIELKHEANALRDQTTLLLRCPRDGCPLSFDFLTEVKKHYETIHEGRPSRALNFGAHTLDLAKYLRNEDKRPVETQSTASTNVSGSAAGRKIGRVLAIGRLSSSSSEAIVEKLHLRNEALYQLACRIDDQYHHKSSLPCVCSLNKTSIVFNKYSSNLDFATVPDPTKSSQSKALLKPFHNLLQASKDAKEWTVLVWSGYDGFSTNLEVMKALCEKYPRTAYVISLGTS